MGNDDWLIRLAGAIPAGDPPDWIAASSTAGTEEQRQLVEELRVVAELAAVHREPGGSGAGEATPFEPRPARWGALEIREQIGSGHFGTVYLAWDGALERQVALKLLRESSAAAQVIREGRLLA